MSIDTGKEISFGDALRLLCDEQWSNMACCGYLVIACEKLSYSREQTQALLKTWNQYLIGVL
jgi:hypothetical protein